MTKLEALLQEAEAWVHEVEDDHGETGGTKLFRRLISALSVMRSFVSLAKRDIRGGLDGLEIDRGWNQALESISGAVENNLTGQENLDRSERRKHLAELTRLSEEYGLYDHEKPVDIPTPEFRLKKLESWCELMGLDIQRVVSLLGTTSLAGYYDSVHSTKKPDNGTVNLNRADISVMLEQEAQTRFGRSADMVLAEYRDGRLDFFGNTPGARGLLVLASLLPKDDPLHVDL